MHKLKPSVLVGTFFIVLVIILTSSLFFDIPRMYIEGMIGDNKVLVGATYFLLTVITTVVAPFAGLPLAPTVSIIVGPFLTGVYSVFGWTIGAIIAFFIARHVARPVLCRFIDMGRVERYEKYIPEKHIFLWLIFLRVIIPVDILSYAIGLTKRVQFPMYVFSTLIGVIPFSFIWSYGGYSLLERDYVMFSIFSGVGLLLFFIALMYYHVRHKERQV